MVIRLGAGRISWGEGFLDPSDMERGCLDKEQNHFLFSSDQIVIIFTNLEIHINIIIIIDNIDL